MYIRPHLDYCDIIYHIPPLSYQFCSSITLHSLMESIERIQYQAALFITGTWKGTDRNKLYDELRWESLSDLQMVSPSLSKCLKFTTDLLPVI